MRARLVVGFVLLGLGCGPAPIGAGTGSGNGGGDGDGDAPDACELFCDTQDACDPDPETNRDDCLTLCTFQIASATGSGNQGCAITLDRGLRCVGDLSCADYQAWKEGQKGEAYPCSMETDEADLACQ